MKKPDAQKNGLRILIVRISAIGDVLHVTSVVHNLRRLLPDAEITWLASPPASLLLETNPDIDRLLVWDRRPMDEASTHFDLRGSFSPASSRAFRVRSAASASTNVTKEIPSS